MERPKNNFKIVSEKKARMILPNAITLIGICIGLTSIKFALDGKFALAIIGILFAGLMDGLDGRIARLIKGTSKMGKGASGQAVQCANIVLGLDESDGLSAIGISP